MDYKEQMARLKPEEAAFEKQLPELLAKAPGQYAIFLGGELRGIRPTVMEAYDFAVKNLGPDAGFLIAPIKKREVMPMPVGLELGIMFGETR